MKADKIKKLPTYSKPLPCALTDAELLKYGGELGKVIQDIGAEEDRADSIKQEMKSRMAGLEAKRSELAAKITRKEEIRDVTVEPVKDFEAGTYYEVRLDTSEQINIRNLHDTELQESII